MFSNWAEGSWSSTASSILFTLAQTVGRDSFPLRSLKSLSSVVSLMPSSFLLRIFSGWVGTATPLDLRGPVALEVQDAAGDILECNICQLSKCLGY